MVDNVGAGNTALPEGAVGTWAVAVEHVVEDAASLRDRVDILPPASMESVSNARGDAMMDVDSESQGHGDDNGKGGRGGGRRRHGKPRRGGVGGGGGRRGVA